MVSLVFSHLSIEFLKLLLVRLLARRASSRVTRHLYNASSGKALRSTGVVVFVWLQVDEVNTHCIKLIFASYRMIIRDGLFYT